MQWLTELFRLLSAPRDDPAPSRWERATAIASVLGAAATALASLFAAWSAFLSLSALNESRVQREPVLSVQPGERTIAFKVRSDGAPLFDPLDEVNRPTNSAETLEISNFGQSPALNLRVHTEWRVSPAEVALPVKIAAERLSTGAPRYILTTHDMAFALDGGGAIRVPISRTGEIREGIVPPGRAIKTIVPYGVAYLVELFGLRDAVADQARWRELDFLKHGPAWDHKFSELALTPVAQRILEVDVNYDTVTGRHLKQVFKLVFATESAGFDPPTPRDPGQPAAIPTHVQARYQARVAETGLPAGLDRH